MTLAAMGTYPGTSPAPVNDRTSSLGRRTTTQRSTTRPGVAPGLRVPVRTTVCPGANSVWLRSSVTQGSAGSDDEQRHALGGDRLGEAPGADGEVRQPRDGDAGGGAEAPYLGRRPRWRVGQADLNRRVPAPILAHHHQGQRPVGAAHGSVGAEVAGQRRAAVMGGRGPDTRVAESGLLAIVVPVDLKGSGQEGHERKGPGRRCSGRSKGW